MERETFAAWLDEFRVNLSCLDADEFGLVLRTIFGYVKRAGIDIQIQSGDDTMLRVADKLDEARLLWSKRQGN